MGGQGIVLAALALSAVAAPAALAAPVPAATATCSGTAGQGRVFLRFPDGLDRTAVVARADAALRHPLASVTAKTTTPPSGDKHDYTSLGTYWWPDPADPHAPWIRRDGQVNPARSGIAFDRTALGTMAGDVGALADAYALTGERRYAVRAAAAIRAWFLDPATAMNPNMNYAQFVPGRSTGRGAGVIDGAGFQDVVDAVGEITPAGVLSADETTALERWFSRYVDWMRTSPIGRAEAAAENNHGLWYDSQLLHFALFARRDDVAHRVATDFAARRLARQIAADGSLPRELTRTRSFHYSLYALTAAYNVAALGRCVGVDLWNWRGKDGRGLQRATDFVARYRGRPDAWPHRELEWAAGELDTLLARANRVWPGRYPDAAAGGGQRPS